MVTYQFRSMKPNLQVRILILRIQIFMCELKINPKSKEKMSQRKSHDLQRILKVRLEKLQRGVGQLQISENVNLWHLT